MSFELGYFVAEIPQINRDTEKLGTSPEKFIISKKTKCFITILYKDYEKRCKIYKDDDGKEYFKYFMYNNGLSSGLHKTYADRLTRA